MSQYTARQMVWMDRVEARTPPEAQVCLGWPDSAYGACREDYDDYLSDFKLNNDEDDDVPDSFATFVEKKLEEAGGEERGTDEFSWAECDLCGTTLGGERHHAVFLADRGNDLTPIEICTDCLLYVANSEVPDEENLSWF